MDIPRILIIEGNKNKVVSRTDIAQALCTGYYFDTHTKVTDVYISYVRNKVDKQFSHKLIGWAISKRRLMPEKVPSLPSSCPRRLKF